MDCAAGARAARPGRGFRFAQYAIAAIAGVAAAALATGFQSLIGASAPDLLSCVAALVVGLLAGLGPGLVCIGMSIAATVYLRGATGLGAGLVNWSDVISLGLALMILGLAVAHRRARIRMAAISKAMADQAQRFDDEMTERLRFESALRHSESTLARSQRIAQLGSWEMDLSTKRLTWTPEACRILGFENSVPHATIEQFLEVIHPDDRDQVVGALDESVNHQTPAVIDFRIKGANGAARHVNVHTEIIGDDGSAMRLLGTVLDVTDRRHSEENLRTSEARTRLVFDSALDAVALLNADGRISGWNAQAERIFGWTAKEITGKHLADVVIPKAARHAFRSGLRRFVSTGQGRMMGRRVEIAALHKHDGEFPVEMSISPVELRDTIIFSVFLRDISEQKKGQEALRSSNEMQKLLLSELNHRVRNNLAGLISLIDMSAASATDIPSLAATISNRVHSMAAVHSMLSHTSWGALSMDEMVNRLIPHGRRGSLRTEGPTVQIPAHQCTAFGMVIGELMANSLKHGALAHSDGAVDVKWEIEQPSDHSMMRVRMQWSERGGPPIDHEPQPQLGTSLIKGFVKSDLRGQAVLSYPASGASHSFEMTFDYSHHPVLGESK